MTNSKVASLHEHIAEEDITRLSEQADERLDSEQSQHKHITLTYLKVAFANRPFKAKVKTDTSSGDA